MTTPILTHTPVAAYDIDALRANEFPLSARTTFLNHASVSPLPARTFTAIQNANERLMHNPTTAYSWFAEQYATFQRTMQTLLNAAHPDEIVTTASTSVGLNLAAQAFPWERGGNVVLCDMEFPSNVYPWMSAARMFGVEVRQAPHVDGGADLEMIRALVDDRTQVIAVSAVQFFSGHRADLAAIGAFCRERGIILSVDAMQAAGHIPLDVQADSIGILCAGGQKSMMGPPGQGVLYIEQSLAERMTPTFVAPNAVDDYLHWLQYKLTPLPSAQRFIMGTFNLSGTVGLLTSTQMLLELGMANVDRYTSALADALIERLDAHNFPVITPRHFHSSIVTFKAADSEAETIRIVAALADRNIIVMNHLDKHNVQHIRASLHCYNTLNEVDWLIEALQTLR